MDPQAIGYEGVSRETLDNSKLSFMKGYVNGQADYSKVIVGYKRILQAATKPFFLNYAIFFLEFIVCGFALFNFSSSAYTSTTNASMWFNIGATVLVGVGATLLLFVNFWNLRKEKQENDILTAKELNVELEDVNRLKNWKTFKKSIQLIKDTFGLSGMHGTLMNVLQKLKIEQSTFKTCYLNAHSKNSKCIMDNYRNYAFSLGFEEGVEKSKNSVQEMDVKLDELFESTSMGLAHLYLDAIVGISAVLGYIASTLPKGAVNTTFNTVAASASGISIALLLILKSTKLYWNYEWKEERQKLRDEADLLGNVGKRKVRKEICWKSYNDSLDEKARNPSDLVYPTQTLVDATLHYLLNCT